MRAVALVHLGLLALKFIRICATHDRLLLLLLLILPRRRRCTALHLGLVVIAVIPSQRLAGPLRILFDNQVFLDRTHLPPDPHAREHSDNARDSEKAEFDPEIGLAADKENTQVDEDELFWEGEEGRHGKVPKAYIAGREDGGGHVGRDDGETDHEDHLCGSVSLVG